MIPPRGPFEATMERSVPPPTARLLPSNAGASSTLITPGPRHRWASKTGLVETLDGSLLLHGIVNGPAHGGRLNVLVLADFAVPESAVITVWDAQRKHRIARSEGTFARVETEGAALAFDIKLPRSSVPIGTYREIETAVWLEDASIDTRRWTVYAGPQPPAPVACEGDQ